MAAVLGFSGQFLIEPKPKKPTKRQYDFDSGIQGSKALVLGKNSGGILVESYRPL